MAGIPALMGIDISGSLKVGIPLAGSGTPQDTIYGVYGGLARKSINAMSAVEREDHLRALEFASPAFIEAVLKAYRMSKTGATMPRGKISIDERVPRQPNSARTDSTGYQEKSEAEKTLRGISGKSRVAIYWFGRMMATITKKRQKNYLQK